MTRLLVLVLIVSSGWLSATSIPGRWEKVDQQPAGSRIVVALKAGGQVDGLLAGTDPHSLTLEVAGATRRLPKSDVRRVELITESVSRKKGLVVGALAGFAAGASLAYMDSHRDRGGLFDPLEGHRDVSVPLAGGLGAVGGGLLGYALWPERRRQQRVTLFVAGP